VQGRHGRSAEIGAPTTTGGLAAKNVLWMCTTSGRSTCRRAVSPPAPPRSREGHLLADEAVLPR
jgi:hypothetical protein